VNFLFNNWQLKVLALAISLALLGALALSTDPIKQVTIQGQVRFDNLDPSVVLVGIQPVVPFPVTGLASDLTRLSDAGTIVVRVDLSKARVGNFSGFGVPVLPPGSGSAHAPDKIPLAFSVDHLVTRTLAVQTVAPNIQAGYQVDSLSTSPGSVTLTGPAGYFDGLTATATYAPVINSDSGSPIPVPVIFMREGKSADPNLQKDYPAIVTDPNPVAVAVGYKAHLIDVTRSVYLTATFTGSIPVGLYSAGLTITPAQIQVTGHDDVISKLGTLPLSAVQLDNMRVGDNQSTVTVQLPTGVTSVQSNQKITLTMTLSSIPTGPTSPTPSPGATPKPTPT
jgi:YbbR domain-containing protein